MVASHDGTPGRPKRLPVNNGSAGKCFDSFPFRVGTGVADITPPLQVGLLMSSAERRWGPFEGIRLPLHARTVIIRQGARQVALVSLELLGLADEAVGGLSSFKERILAASGRVVSADQLILTATHTHSAPESLALSDLYRTSAFQSWVESLARGIGQALRSAAEHLRDCRLATGSAPAHGLAVHRRIRTTRGIVLSHPVPPPEIVLSRDGAVDSLVNVAVFHDSSAQPLCVLVNAASHAVHEMCCPRISSDYPGVMSAFLEDRYDGATVLFLNGAAGNLNPPTVSGGPAAADHHGRELGRIVENTLSRVRPTEDESFALLWQPVELPARTITGERSLEPLQTRLAALRLGGAAFLFLPGEPFAETSLAIRVRSPFASTFVVGYAEASIGYIPTDQAFQEGGYEIGPGAWSRVAPGSEGIIRRAAIDLLTELLRTQSGPSATAHNASAGLGYASVRPEDESGFRTGDRGAVLGG